MATKFKYMRSLKLSYAEQGEIFFRCQNYRKQDEKTQEHIRGLCVMCGGGDGQKRQAIFELMTTRKSWRAVCMEHYVSDATLDRLRRKFFTEWKTYEP